MPLTDTTIRKAKPESKSVKLYDERGLFLLVSPKGGKWWRFKYRFDGKEKQLSLGVYPDVSLKDARERRDDARKLVANEIDPSENRKAIKAVGKENAENTFELIAREWFAKHSKSIASDHATRIIRRLEKNFFPYIGDKPIKAITATDLLAVLRRIESRGALNTTRRALVYVVRRMCTGCGFKLETR